MTAAEITLPSPHDVGKLKIKQLKRFWQATQHNKNNALNELLQQEWQLNKTLLGVLNLGLEQTIVHIYQNNLTFESFEDWIISTAGAPNEGLVKRFNNLFDKESAVFEDIEPVLSDDDLAFFKANGYIVLNNAVPQEDCLKTIDVICDFLDIDKNNPASWYKHNDAWQGIMVQLFQHPLINKNRNSEKIRGAYEQLWKTKNIWLTADRVGFNPPETDQWKFPGPDLHWDCSLQLPIPFGLQGILYLNDVAANQGAFTLVPDFQHRIKDWLASLPPGADSRKQDLHALGSKPITGQAGDFIIWQQALPHGSSPNTALQPRYVQYINYLPVEFTAQSNWK